MGPLATNQHESSFDFETSMDAAVRFVNNDIKEEPEAAKRVRFSPTSELYEFEDEFINERWNLWYSKSDFKVLSRRNKTDLRAARMSRGRTLDPDAFCTRGLELGHSDKMKRKSYVWFILNEQERYRDHTGGMRVDPHYLSGICSQSEMSFQATVDAYRRGINDYEAAYGDDPRGHKIRSCDMTGMCGIGTSGAIETPPQPPKRKSIERLDDSGEGSAGDEIRESNNDKQEDFDPISVIKTWGSAVISIAN